MYKIEFYKDKNGYSEISEYFYDLVQRSKTDKNARINKNKMKEIEKALLNIKDWLERNGE